MENVESVPLCIKPYKHDTFFNNKYYMATICIFRY